MSRRLIEPPLSAADSPGGEGGQCWTASVDSVVSRYSRTLRLMAIDVAALPLLFMAKT